MTFITLVRNTVMTVACMNLVACAQFDTIRNNISKPEVVGAKQSGSIYKGGSIDIGQMIKMYNKEQVIIAVGDKFLSQVSDDVSRKLPKNLEHMVISSLSKMGSKQVKVVDVKYKNEIDSRGKALYEIKGGVTELDVRERDSLVENGGLSIQELPFSTRHVDNIWGDRSLIVLDLSLHNLKTGFVDQTITVAIELVERGGKTVYAVSFLGLGAGVKGSFEQSSGLHRVTRTALDFATTGLIGRLHNLPYWTVLQGSSPDEKLISELAQDFVQKSPVENRKSVQEQLTAVDPSLTVDGKFGAKSKAALNKFLKIAGDEWVKAFDVDNISMNEVFNSAFYVNLFSIKPCVESSQKVRELRFGHCYVKPIES